MNARDFIPGVPSAGHLTPAGAFWHPGPAASCRKPACDPKHRAALRDKRERRDASDDGR
jgi:hypothetical protein